MTIAASAEPPHIRAEEKTTSTRGDTETYSTNTLNQNVTITITDMGEQT